MSTDTTLLYKRYHVCFSDDELRERDVREFKSERHAFWFAKKSKDACVYIYDKNGNFIDSYVVS